MQILALGCISHFLPLLPSAHQEPHRILPTDPLWTRAISMSEVNAPWETNASKTKGRKRMSLNIQMESVPPTGLSGMLLCAHPPSWPLSPSTCVCSSPGQNSSLSQNTRPAFLQWALMECWFVRPMLFVQIKCNHLYAGRILTTLRPMPSFKVALAQEHRLVLLSRSLCFI